MPRFVLLYHECPPGYERTSHWDLMLETGDALRTWALEQLPRDWHAAHLQTTAFDPRCPPISDDNSVVAESLANHRLTYLDYEGPLSDNRGRVSRVASGDFRIRSTSPDSWCVILSGGMTGTVMLRKSSPDDPIWVLVYAPGN